MISNFRLSSSLSIAASLFAALSAPLAMALPVPSGEESSAGSSQATAATSQAAGIRSLCPGVDSALQQALAGAWMREGSPAVVEVSMQVDGDQVTNVKTRGFSSSHNRAVRRAVSALSCHGAHEGPSTVAFEVDFVDTPAATRAAKLALAE